LGSTPRASPAVLRRPPGDPQLFLQDEHGRSSLTHSISAGLDYASVGPEHAWLHDNQRAEYVSCSDEDALEAAVRLSRTEGIIPALESAHAVAEAIRRAPPRDQSFIVNLSGRGRQRHRHLSRKTSRISTKREPYRTGFRQGKVLVAYITAGDPDPARTPLW